MKNKKKAEETLRYKNSRTYSGGDCYAIMTAALLIVIIAYCTVVFGVALFGMSEMKAYAMEPGSLPEEQAARERMMARVRITVTSFFILISFHYSRKTA